MSVGNSSSAVGNSDRVVVAEFSAPRILMWLSALAVALVFFVLSRGHGGGPISNFFDRAGPLRALMEVGGGLLLLGGGILVVRVLFAERAAVYVHNRKLISVWLFGTTQIDFDEISSISIGLLSLMLIVRGKDGREVNLPIGLMKQSSEEVLARLNEEIGLN